jgi:hypothetical protein
MPMPATSPRVTPSARLRRVKAIFVIDHPDCDRVRGGWRAIIAHGPHCPPATPSRQSREVLLDLPRAFESDMTGLRQEGHEPAAGMGVQEYVRNRRTPASLFCSRTQTTRYDRRES